MACVRIKIKPSLLSESLKKMDRHHDAEQIIWSKRDKMIGQVADGFICGDFEGEICNCGNFAEYLCDHPISNGQTCDMPICEDCRVNLGEEIDVCKFHSRLIK